jgi:hypothetical protein
MEEQMFKESRRPWSNDPLVLMLSAVLIGASIDMYFSIVHGWSW